MDRSWSTDSNEASRSGHWLSDRVSRHHLNGLAAIVVGLSQLPLAFMFADATGYESSIYVVGGGGWMLIGVGINEFRGMEAFEIDWSASNRVAWYGTVLTCILAGVVAVAALLIIT